MNVPILSYLRSKIMVVALASLFSVQAFSDIVLVDQNEKISEGYFIFEANLTSRELFTEYATAAAPIIQGYNGQPIITALGTQRQVVEGESSKDWTIILNLPDEEAALDWYFSEAYQNVIPIRQSATENGSMIFVPGLPQSKIEWEINNYRNVDVSLKEPLRIDRSPEYIIEVPSTWNRNIGSYSLVGKFSDPVNIKSAQMSIEFQMLAEDNPKANVRVFLVDTAGRKSLVTRVRSQQIVDGWYTATAQFDQVQNKRNREFNRIEIEVLNRNRSENELQFKNFKIWK